MSFSGENLFVQKGFPLDPPPKTFNMRETCKRECEGENLV